MVVPVFSQESKESIVAQTPNQKVWLLLIVLIGIAAAGNTASVLPQSVQKLSAETLDDRIIVRINDSTFTVYRFGAGQKYPYFYPVNGPVSGESLTSESSLPWPHHRSLFFGCDQVNGGNYWQEGNDRGQIVSTGAKIIRGGPDYVEISDECSWRQPGRNPVISERRRIRIEAPSAALRMIDFETEARALVPIEIKKTNHSLFSARVRHELSVSGGGSLVNAEGAEKEKGTYGIASPWADFSGKVFGRVEGLAIFDSPHNPWFPSQWFTRDYGFLSPTPFFWLDESGFRIKEGDALKLRYRVVIHAGDAAEASIAQLFKQWAAAQK